MFLGSLVRKKKDIGLLLEGNFGIKGCVCVCVCVKIDII